MKTNRNTASTATVARAAPASEILLGAADATALRALLEMLEHLNRFDAAADALDALLDNARIVGDDGRPQDVVALDSMVDYRELPSGPLRMIAIVMPERADAGIGRVSVLSPVGRALLGRRSGASSEVSLPDGRRLRLSIAAVRAPAAP